MKVLVTGVTGRVGRNLAAALLARGDEVRGLVLPDDPGLEKARASGVECLTGNLRDLETATAAVAGVAAVVHLGAMMLWGSDDQNPILFEDNLRGTFNLAYLAERTGFPVVDARIPGPPLRIAHSTAKARALLGYTPNYDIFRSIDDGVAGP